MDILIIHLAYKRFTNIGVDQINAYRSFAGKPVRKISFGA
jgi:hypothetical protein